MPVHETRTGLFARLLARLGDMPGHQHAPVRAIDDVAAFLRRVFRKAPLHRQCRKAFRGRGADGDHARAVLAC